ncbi:MAG TPA: class I SAM-dependent methyltransferase [Spirochaetia bacterium]|nr:class I SAM-dependent methyltransferase [Spirochaetia bacterium]
MNSTRVEGGFLPDDGNLPAVIKQLEIPPCSCLEIGCGTGANSIWLSSRGFECTGIDPASAALRIAADLAKAAGVSIRWIRGVFPEDLGEEAVPEESVRFIFDRGVFELITFPQQQRRFLKRVANLLPPDGTYYTLISRKQGTPLPGGGPLWTAAEIRRAVSPHLRILLLRPALLIPGDKNSAPVWICVASRKKKKWLEFPKFRFPAKIRF